MEKSKSQAHRRGFARLVRSRVQGAGFCSSSCSSRQQANATPEPFHLVRQLSLTRSVGGGAGEDGGGHAREARGQ
eukprot:3919575-Rhodomonas_salina.1